MRSALTMAVMTVMGLGLGPVRPTEAEVVTERWGNGVTCRHRGLTISSGADGATVIRFDLSALRRGTKICRASLRVDRRIRKRIGGPKPGQTLHAASGVGGGLTCPRQPIGIYELGGDGKVVGEPLALEPPRYASFDATRVVRHWVSGEGANRGLLIQPPAFIAPRRLVLEITYEGKLEDPPPPVKGLKVFHRAGQTFITWTEIDRIVTTDKLRWSQYRKLSAKGSPRGEVLYRIYAHDRPITARTIASATRIDEVGPLSGYDGRIRQNRTRGEIFQGRDPNVIVPRYCIGPTPPPGPFQANSQFVDGKKRAPEWLAQQLPLYTGLYVHNPRRPGKRYYAVVTCVNGVENTRDFSAENSLQEPVTETVGPGEPILYRRLDLSRRRGRKKEIRETQFFAYWANPPYASLPQRVVHFLVGVEGPEPSPPRSMHVRVGIRDMYWSELVGGTHPHEWRGRPHLAVALVADWSVAGIGYHSSYGTLKAYSQGCVEPYAIRLLDLILPYVQRRWKVNPGRISCSGTFLGLHLPHIFTYTVAGGHQTVMNLKWSPLGRSLPKRWGPPGLARTPDGANAYDLVDASAIVRKDPRRETPFLYCPGGKGPGHQTEIGWTQNPKAYRALMDTKRPFVAVWGMRLRQAGRFTDMDAWDHNVPAFGNCSLDDNPGSGHLLDGDFSGQINGYLWWEPKTGTDEKDRWALTVYLVDECRAETCTVDVTPRRLKNFKPAPGEKFKWTNTSLANKRLLQSGTVTADEWGLVTLKGVTVTKGRNRLEIRRPR